MSSFASLADVGGLLELTVPSYGLRLVRRFGAERVGWFIVIAFGALAALHLLSGAQTAGTASCPPIVVNAIYAFIILLLLIGMGHLETVFSCDRQASRAADPGLRCLRAAHRARFGRSITPSAGALRGLAGRARARAFTEGGACSRRRGCEAEAAGTREGVRELAGWLGQNLNNALLLIRGQSRLLLERQQDSSSVEQLRQILAAANRAGMFSRELLVLGGRYLADWKPLALNAVLAGFAQTLRALVGKQIMIKYSLAMDVPPILADTRLLQHVILNLVLDAREALRGKGTIVITSAVVHFDSTPAEPGPQAKPGDFVRLAVCAVNNHRPARPPQFPAPSFRESGQGGLRRASVDAAVEQLSTWSEIVTDEGSTEFRVYFTPVPPGV